jgi:predicted MFS family arabinose efflux permease
MTMSSTSALAAGAPTHAARELLLASGLALGPMVVTGIARFAYGLLLPAMQVDLGWSFTQAGAMNTANGLGYLIGTVLSLRLAGAVDARRTFGCGLLITALALIASGAVRSLEALLALRAIAGIASALAFVSGTALAARIGPPQRAPLAIAVYFSGAGLGIVLSGAALPALFERSGAAAWPLAWLALGATALLCTLPSVLACAALPSTRGARHAATWRAQPLAPSFAGHFLFGAGYIVYMTFVLTWMATRGSSAIEVSAMWALLGAAIMASPWIWRGLLRDGRGGAPLATSIFVLAAGAALPLCSTAWPGMALSAALVGSAVMIPAAASTAFVRRCVRQPGADAALATYSVVFAAGQCIGPVPAGFVADATGSLSAALALSAALLLLGAAIASRQREMVR